MPPQGLGSLTTLEHLAGPVLGAARDLGAPGFFAHMDPPTPWITWAASMWTASRNQNLLHPDTAPVARDIEERVVTWFAPLFGMEGGHMTSGSTVANLTALWAAREAGATRVVTTTQAHLSVKKAARILGMGLDAVVDWADVADLNLADAAAVVTAGATTTGQIEPLDAAAGAAWRHVDAAWAGPLRLSPTHRHLLEGIETADSVAVSAHKWLFQPKESALVFFADSAAAHASISIDAPYLAVPNVGLLGSHGATAVPLLATVLAHGSEGIAAWIDTCMGHADALWRAVDAHPDLEARSAPHAGVLNWRHRSMTPDATVAVLEPDVFVSTATIDGERWLRSVAANPMADPSSIISAVTRGASA